MKIVSVEIKDPDWESWGGYIVLEKGRLCVDVDETNGCELHKCHRPGVIFVRAHEHVGADILDIVPEPDPLPVIEDQFPRNIRLKMNTFDFLEEVGVWRVVTTKGHFNIIYYNIESDGYPLTFRISFNGRTLEETI